MSYLTEKMSYIRGLAEGLNIDETTKEGKLLLAVVDALSDTADSMAEMADIQDDMQEQLDEVDSDLAGLEDYVYEEDEEDEDEDEEFGIECPSCGDMIYLDPEMLDGSESKLTCPSCGEDIELEFDCDCANCDECGE